jgi:hypothetical protein
MRHDAGVPQRLPRFTHPRDHRLHEGGAVRGCWYGRSGSQLILRPCPRQPNVSATRNAAQRQRDSIIEPLRSGRMCGDPMMKSQPPVTCMDTLWHRRDDPSDAGLIAGLMPLGTLPSTDPRWPWR